MFGLARTNASTIGLCSSREICLDVGHFYIKPSNNGYCIPLGTVAGASAINKLILLFNSALTERPAKATAVPCENPT